MTCEHKRLKCVNCEFVCLDCGVRIDPPKVEKPPEGAAEAATNEFEHPSGRKIGFDAEKPKRRTKKGETK